MGPVSNLQRQHSNQPRVPSPEVRQAAQKGAPFPRLSCVLLQLVKQEAWMGRGKRSVPKRWSKCHSEVLPRHMQELKGKKL